MSEKRLLHEMIRMAMGGVSFFYLFSFFSSFLMNCLGWVCGILISRGRKPCLDVIFIVVLFNWRWISFFRVYSFKFKWLNLSWELDCTVNSFKGKRASSLAFISLVFSFVINSCFPTLILTLLNSWIFKSLAY